MGTYRLTQSLVSSGPGCDVLPAGTLIGDGTPYPIPKDAKGVEQIPKSAVKADPPKPPVHDGKPAPEMVVDSGASPGGPKTVQSAKPHSVGEVHVPDKAPKEPVEKPKGGDK